jgi:transposase-like protein
MSSLLSLFKKFPTEQDCIKHLENIRWKNGIVCPYCQSKKTCKHLHRHQCQDCHKSFSVTVGTIFHHTHLPLQKWLMAIALVADAKKGISSRQLSRNLELPVKTGYSLMMRIRKAFDVKNPELLGNIFEMDETYIKTHSIAKDDKEDDDFDDDIPHLDSSSSAAKPALKRGRGSQNNTAIIGIQEKSGSIVAKVVDNCKFDTLYSFAKNIAKEGSEIHTDQFKAYARFKRGFNHKTVNHQREYVSAEKITTNGVENFWGLLKRGIKGQFHHLSKFYLQEYINEFAYRFNLRKFSQEVVFEKMLGRMLFI